MQNNNVIFDLRATDLPLFLFGRKVSLLLRTSLATSIIGIVDVLVHGFYLGPVDILVESIG